MSSTSVTVAPTAVKTDAALSAEVRLMEALWTIQDAYLSLCAGRLEEAEGLLSAHLAEVEKGGAVMSSIIIVLILYVMLALADRHGRSLISFWS